VSPCTYGSVFQKVTKFVRVVRGICKQWRVCLGSAVHKDDRGGRREFVDVCVVSQYSIIIANERSPRLHRIRCRRYLSFSPPLQNIVSPGAARSIGAHRVHPHGCACAVSPFGEGRVSGLCGGWIFLLGGWVICLLCLCHLICLHYGGYLQFRIDF